MKRMIYITDSMSSAELDSDGSLFLEFAKDGKPIGLTWRVARVAQGSGTTVREVEEVLCQYRMMANMAKQAGGKNGWLQTMQKVQNATGGRGRGAGGMPTPAQIQAMQVRALMKDTYASSAKDTDPTVFYFFFFSRIRSRLACSNRCNDK
jgi:signal recognition particle subunit SRP54